MVEFIINSLIIHLQTTTLCYPVSMKDCEGLKVPILCCNPANGKPHLISFISACVSRSLNSVLWLAATQMKSVFRQPFEQIYEDYITHNTYTIHT